MDFLVCQPGTDSQFSTNQKINAHSSSECAKVHSLDRTTYCWCHKSCTHISKSLKKWCSRSIHRGTCFRRSACAVLRGTQFSIRSVNAGVQNTRMRYSEHFMSIFVTYDHFNMYKSDQPYVLVVSVSQAQIRSVKPTKHLNDCMSTKYTNTHSLDHTTYKNAFYDVIEVVAFLINIQKSDAPAQST